MRTWALIAAAMFLSATVRADTVAMPEKLELSGKKIEILEIRDEDVLVRVAYGDILIARSRIKSMTVDFKDRLAQLMEKGEDTPRALYALGRVCRQLEMGDEAATAYREAFQRGNVPEDLLLPIAAELEGCEEWASAQKCYAAYLKLHPDDAEAAAKARAAAAKAAAAVPKVEAPAGSDAEIEITQAPRTGVARTAKPVAPVGVEPAQPEPAQPEPAQPEPAQPAQPGVDEGLESDPSWATEAWGSSIEVSVGAPEGTNDKMVRVFLAGAEQDKACVMLAQDFDLTKKKEMTFEVFNFAKHAVTVAVAFTTVPGWKFYESVPKTILPTKGGTPKTVTIDVTSTKFKCAETKWRYKSPLQNRNRVGKVYLLLYTRQTGHWLFFNNIRFVDAEPAAAPAPAPAGGAPVPAPVPPAPNPAPAAAAPQPAPPAAAPALVPAP